MSRTNVSSGLDEDGRSGQSRAVRIGNIVRTGGIGPVGRDGNAVGDDAAEQTINCFEAIGAALEAAGASLGDIVHTRIELTDADDREAVESIHGQLFQDVRPACTLTVVSALRDPTWRVQIEAAAILSAEGTG